MNTEQDEEQAEEQVEQDEYIYCGLCGWVHISAFQEHLHKH